MAVTQLEFLREKIKSLNLMADFMSSTNIKNIKDV